jgi:hypothetical protein
MDIAKGVINLVIGPQPVWITSGIVVAQARSPYFGVIRPTLVAMRTIYLFPTLRVLRDTPAVQAGELLMLVVAIR